MKKAVFLDRDGVINRKMPEGHFVTRWKDMEIPLAVPELSRCFRTPAFAFGLSAIKDAWPSAFKQ
jgi:histidinol phosphatase-like enzyme